MLIENASSFVELDISSPAPATGSRRAGAGVAHGDFRGARADLFFEAGEFERFVGALRDLERERRGRAALSADDPRLFSVEIRAVDRAGHLEVRGRIGTGTFAEGEASLTFQFPFAAERLPALLRQVEAVASAV